MENRQTDDKNNRGVTKEGGRSLTNKPQKLGKRN